VKSIQDLGHLLSHKWLQIKCRLAGSSAQAVQYAHFVPDQKREAVARIEKALGEGNNGCP
jgi:hypothetical protein